MRWFVVSLLTLSAPAAAQQPVSAELVSDPFLESYQPEVSVSGNIIVGVMTIAAAAALASNDIAVMTATEMGGKHICLRVASRDGIYTSKNVYSGPAHSSGPVLLPYKSTLLDVVSGYGDDEIALAATTGECDSGSADYLLLSSAKQTQPADVAIYLNSFGATDVFYQLDDTVEACDYLSEGRRTTFDFICRLGPIESHADVPVTIIRERFGREQPAVELRILSPSQ